MTHKSFALFAVLIISFLSGCATQNVRPYFEGAISKFEDAHKIENTIIETEAGRQLSEFTALFDNLEKAALSSMTVLITSGWDSTTNDFKEISYSEAWAGWFGVTPETEIPNRDYVIQKSLISTYLNETITMDCTLDSGTPRPDEPIKMYHQFTTFKGKKPAPGMKPATDADAKRLSSGYDEWVKRFETDVLKKAPVYLSILEARKTALDSVNNVKTRRIERTKLVYENLIAIAQLGKEQADTLTKHAGFIQLANKIFAISKKIGNTESKSLVAEPQLIK